MGKIKKRVIIAIIILLLVFALIPFIYTFIVAVNNMAVGFVYDFRGTEIYGLNAFVKTFILYVWLYWPIIIFQFLSVVAAAVLTLFLFLKGKKYKTGV